MNLYLALEYIIYTMHIRRIYILYAHIPPNTSSLVIIGFVHTYTEICRTGQHILVGNTLIAI